MASQVVKPNTVPTKRLATSITPSSTAFRLSDTLGWDGVALAVTDLGDQAYGCFRDASGTTLELFEYDPTTITASSITILRRGLKFTGDRTTSVTANKLTWIKNTTLVELGTSMPQFFQWLKEYIDAASIAGGVPATTTVLGLNKMSVAPASAGSPIAVGDNDPRILPNAYAVDSVGTDAYAITLSTAPSAYVAGQLYVFKAGTINTGPATLNVNTLGAKTILRSDGVTALVTGDITSGEIVEVVYDGTNFRLLKSFRATPDVQTFNSSGTWTKPADSAGKMARIQVWAGGGGGATDGGGASTGGGGGGGGYAEVTIPISSLGSTETVTIPAAAAAGAGGGTVTFGTWATAYGGGGGVSNSTGTIRGGGGGGPLGTGIGTAAGSPGDPLAGSAQASPLVGKDALYGAGGGSGAGNGGNAYYGGGGGAGSGTGQTGGTSVFGGAGGNVGVNGTAPGGGGGAGLDTGVGSAGLGAVGRVTVTVY